jgi:uncharacterized membrane protein
VRQLNVYVPRDRSADVLAAGRACHAVILSRSDVEVEDRPFHRVSACLSNAQVESFLEHVEPIGDLHVTFFPQGVLALTPPPSEAPDQVTDVQPRSPIETFLAGHQSIGSWAGFLGYAAAAGIVVWVGLFTGTVFLLTAAMLIAPFAGPAMNAAIATAAGDGILLRKSVQRYMAALTMSAVVAFVLSLGFQLRTPTAAMLEFGKVSLTAALIPLAAGAVGALFLTSSDRSSLVSGAAVGVLVAASLAPPVGIAGMAAAIGRWDLVLSSTYVLVLQLVGINLSGAAVFRLFGLSQGGTRYETTSQRLFPVGIAVSTLLLGSLLAWQLTQPVALQRPDVARQASVEMQEALRANEGIEPVEVTARFPQAGMHQDSLLLGEVMVLPRRDSATLSPDTLQRRLENQLQERLRRRWPHVKPLVSVVVFSRPEPPSAPQ